MNKPCEGCALTSGAAANCEPDNHLTAMLCVLGGIPFYCHSNFDWKNTNSIPRSEAGKRGLRICQGWKREVAALAATGYYREHPDATKSLAAIGIQALKKFATKGVDQAEKDQAFELLDSMVKELVEKRKRFEK